MLIDLSQEEIIVALNLMKAGLASQMREPGADQVIDTYVHLRARLNTLAPLPDFRKDDPDAKTEPLPE
jgi:hypothetical protein